MSWGEGTDLNWASVFGGPCRFRCCFWSSHWASCQRRLVLILALIWSSVSLHWSICYHLSLWSSSISETSRSEATDKMHRDAYIAFHKAWLCRSFFRCLLGRVLLLLLGFTYLTMLYKAYLKCLYMVINRMFLVNCKLVVMFLRVLLCLVALCGVLLWGMAVHAQCGGGRALCFSIACFQPRQTFSCITEISKLQKCKRIWIHLSETQQRHSFWWKEAKHCRQISWWYSAIIY